MIRAATLAGAVALCVLAGSARAADADPTSDSGAQAPVSAASAVTRSAAARPRIGLALSGGGARGFSHVGVLRALERLRVPVDCIAGTSAGSAVGAAYAVGLSPDEIEARLRSADWGGDIFDDAPGRDELSHRDKIRTRGEPIGITLGVGASGLKGASGVVAGQKIEFFLHRMLGTSLEYPDFDALALPFRAIATDLVTGKAAVQRSGSLVHAVRASMAVPSAFSPVQVDGRLLVDGGLTQNLPVAAVRDTCADIVIAVDISSPLLGADELGSVFGVALQMINILMERNVADSLASLRAGDVLIRPELGALSAVDFARGVDGIPAGDAAVMGAAGQLARLALDEAEYARWQQSRLARVRSDPAIDRVRVAPTRFVNPEVYARDRGGDLDGRIPGDELERVIRRWTASGDFTSIAWSVRPERDGHTLWIDPKEKPWGPDYLQIGFVGSADSHGYSDFSVQGALRRTWMNRWGAEWLTVARFGRVREVETSWFQPLGVGSAWYLMPRASLSVQPRRIFSGNSAIGEFSLSRLEVELAAGVQGRYGDFRVGLVGARVEVEPTIGFSGVPATAANVNGLRAKLTYDRLDELDFPRSGSAAGVDLFAATSALGAEGRYLRGDLDAMRVQSFGAHTLRGRLRWASTGGEFRALRDTVSVGGFLNLSGYQSGQFLGSGLLYGSLTYYNQLMPLPKPFGSGLYAGASLEAARIRDAIGAPTGRLDRFGAAIFVGAATSLGPLYLGLGVGQDGNRAVYLFLGRP